MPLLLARPYMRTSGAPQVAQGGGTGNKQLIFGTVQDDFATGTVYASLQGGFDWNASIGLNKQIIPTGGGLGELRIDLEEAPGAGNSVAFTLMVDGVASAMVVTVSNTDIIGDYTGDDIAVTAGQSVELRSVGTSTPTTSVARWCCNWTPTIKGEYILLGSTANFALSNTLTEFANLYGGSSPNTNHLFGSQRFPTGGILKKLYLETAGAPGEPSKSYAFTVHVDASATGITATISETATKANDTVNTAVIATNGVAALEIVPSTSPAQETLAYGIVFVPTIPGEAPVMETPGGNLSTSGTNYTFIGGDGARGFSATQELRQNVLNACTIKNWYGSVSVAAGADPNKWTMAVLVDEVASAMELIFSGESEVEETDVTNTLTVTAGELFQIRVIPASTPSSNSVFRSGMVMIGPEYQVQ